MYDFGTCDKKTCLYMFWWKTTNKQTHTSKSSTDINDRQ